MAQPNMPDLAVAQPHMLDLAVAQHSALVQPQALTLTTVQLHAPMQSSITKFPHNPDNPVVKEQ